MQLADFTWSPPRLDVMEFDAYKGTLGRVYWSRLLPHIFVGVNELFSWSILWVRKSCPLVGGQEYYYDEGYNTFSRRASPCIAYLFRVLVHAFSLLASICGTPLPLCSAH